MPLNQAWLLNDDEFYIYVCELYLVRLAKMAKAACTTTLTA